MIKETPDPEITTGLYTEDPTACVTGICPLFLIINWDTFLSSNLITSSPIRTSPVLSQPTVEKTFTLLPSPSVESSSFSKRVFVDIAKNPFTVSGAKAIFHITSSSKVPSGNTLSTVADAYPYSSDGFCTTTLPIRDLGSPDTTFTFSA